jgi:hypothetical protein
MKTKFMILIAALGLTAASSRGALTTGDISIIGFRSDADDGLSFVTWAEISAGTSIYFTDSGFFNDDTVRDSEGTMSWTAPIGGVAAGTVIVISSPSSTSSVNIGTTVGGLSGLSSSGDQIFAGLSAFPTTADTTKPGSIYSGTLLYGINFDTTNWAADATSTNNSALPSSLNILYGNIAIAEADNAQYTGTRSFASIELAKAAIHNTSNWTSDNDGLTVGSLNSTAIAIPEPSSIIMIGLVGLAAVVILRKRK